VTAIPAGMFRHAVRLHPNALACNLGNVLRTLATPEPVQGRSTTSLREMLIRIGARIVSRGCQWSALPWPLQYNKLGLNKQFIR
jgi:hypothetical protein